MSALIAEAMPAYSAVFAVNYDSPFLFYPLLQPHGKTLAGIETCSRYRISGAERRSLPIDEGVMKLIDLDRCYSVTRIPVQGGGELCLFNVHLTAYTEDPAIVDGQIAMLFGEMAEEYAAGNYVLCGGDFNRDLWGNSGEVFPTETPTPSWALAFPTEKIPDGFALCRPEGAPVPTCRTRPRRMCREKPLSPCWTALLRRTIYCAFRSSMWTEAFSIPITIRCGWNFC